MYQFNFRRIQLPAVAAIALAACGAPDLFAQPQYIVDPIEAPAGFAVYPTAINNAGVVVGWWYGSPVDNRHPFIYSKAAGYNQLPKPSGHLFSVPQDINDAGVIVGFATPTWSDETNPRGWRYENGAFTMFPPQSSASDINSTGLIVGKTCYSNATSSFTCMFSSQDPPAITTFPGAGGYPGSMWKYIFVNDSGQMAYNLSGTSVVFRDVDGTLTPLPPPPSGWTGMRVDGINNHGQVIARWTRSTSQPLKWYSRGFVWSAATGAQEFGITAYSVRPKGINDNGQVIVETGTHDQAFFDCWLWSPQTGAVNLDEKTDYGSNLVLTDLYGINNAGQILVGGDTITQTGYRYFVLEPAAPPAVPGDITGDGVVNVNDMLAVINAWGQCPAPPQSCPADIAPPPNGDGAVNVNDLLMVINNWG